MHRAFLFPAVFLVAAILFGGCSDRTANPPEDPRITVLAFRNPIQAGDTLTLYATLSSGDNSTIRWEMIPGPADYGSITPQGLYTSPKAIVEDSIYVRVKATSLTTNATATATIVVARGEFRHLPPSIGSTVTYSSYQVDAAGRKIDGSDRQWVETLVSTTASIAGRDSVAIFAGPQDTTIVRYLPGGDLLYGLRRGPELFWRPLPFGSRSDAIDSRPDSMIEGGGRMTDTTRLTYAGQDVVPVGTKSFVARRIRQVSTRKATGSLNFTELITEDIWYAGAVGTIVRIDRTIERTEGGSTTIRGERRSMVDCRIE